MDKRSFRKSEKLQDHIPILLSSYDPLSKLCGHELPHDVREKIADEYFCPYGLTNHGERRAGRHDHGQLVEEVPQHVIVPKCNCCTVM